MQTAIEQGLTILNWFENLPEDERPPEYIWEDSQGLEMWWKTVDDKRNDGVETNKGHADSAQDDQPRVMTENDHARFVKEAYS